MTVQPLAGRRVLVTRAAHQAGKLSQGLRALGAEAVEVPVLEIRPPLNFEPLDAAIANLDTYRWLILTSANAVLALEAVLRCWAFRWLATPRSKWQPSARPQPGLPPKPDSPSPSFPKAMWQRVWPMDSPEMSPGKES